MKYYLKIDAAEMINNRTGRRIKRKNNKRTLERTAAQFTILLGAIFTCDADVCAYLWRCLVAMISIFLVHTKPKSNK